jgi:WD40 repeat protein
MKSFTKLIVLVFILVTTSSIVASCTIITPDPILQPTFSSTSESVHPQPSTPNSSLGLAPTRTATLTSTPTAPPTLTPSTTRSPISISASQRLGNGELQQIEWSPDGQTIIVGTSIGIFVLSSADLSINNKFETEGWVHNLAIHPSGFILSTGADKGNLENITLWDIQDGILTNTLRGSPRDVVTDVDFSPDGSKLVSGTNNGKLFLWSLADPQLIRVLLDSPVSGERFIRHVLFSRDGSLIVAGDDGGAIWLFDVETGQVLLSFEGDFKSIQSLDISPDNRRIAVAGSLVHVDEPLPEQSGMIVYDAASGVSIYRGDAVTQGSINFALFSPDNQSLIVGSCLHYSRITERCVQGILQQRNSQDGSNPLVLREYASSPSAGSYSPDGMLFAVITWDIVPVIEVWDMKSNQMTNSREWYVGPSSPVVFTPDSHTVISGDPDGLIRFWDVETGTVVSTLDAQGAQGEMITNLAISPDGNLLASSCLYGEIKLWDLSASRISQTIQTTEGFQIGQLQFSPDGQWLIWDEVELDLGNQVQLFHLSQNAFVNTTVINQTIFDIAISPDSSMLAIGGFTDSEDNIRVFEIATGNLLWSYMAPEYITSVAFSSDGTVLAAGCLNSMVLFLEAESGEFIQQVLAGGSYPSTTRISFFPNDPILVTTAGWSLKLWNVTTYQLLLTIERRWYSGSVLSISPNSLIIACETRTGTTLLWKVYGIGG